MSYRLIVGLGNPGKKYDNTRHNAGFLGIDAIHYEVMGDDWKSKNHALVSQVRLGEQNIILAKPQTYMNVSGKSVQSLMASFRVKPEEVLVLVDDVHLEMGKLRIRREGSHGGQNGLRDIIRVIGPKFARIRIGVGLCPQEMDLAGFVLAQLRGSERDLLHDVARVIPDVVKTINSSGLDKGMNQYNGKVV